MKSDPLDMLVQMPNLQEGKNELKCAVAVLQNVLLVTQQLLKITGFVTESVDVGVTSSVLS